MKTLRLACRVLLGLVFIFSGFVKGVDPMGSTIKFTEYFEVFHLTWLGSLALILSIALSTAEFLIGVALITGIRMKTTAWAALIFMGFFTILTFYSALANPVSDCGCFGDALVITNWQTFYKNIVLSALAIIIFYQRKKYIPFSLPIIEWSLVAFFALFGTGISVYSWRHLPIVDFRPYSIGTHIPSKMVMPEGKKGDEYGTTLIYTKNGVAREFNLQNYPWQDSTWIFKEQKSYVVKKGYTIPIKSFTISASTGQDIGPELLADTSYSFVFITHDMPGVKAKEWNTIKKYYSYMAGQHHKFYFVSSSTHEEAADIQKKYSLPFDIYYADQTNLKTIMRSNPGLLLLKDGVILGLWHYNDFPEPSYFKGNILSIVLTDNHKTIERHGLFFVGISLLAVFSLMINYKRNGTN